MNSKDHPESLKVIRTKCRGIVKNLVISGSTYEVDSFFPRVNSLSKDILKIRSKWIDYYDVFKIFYNVLGDEVLKLDNHEMVDGQKFWDVVGEEKGVELSDNLYNFYLSIPRSYNIYLPLPSVEFDITQRIIITPEVSFHTFFDIINNFKKPTRDSSVSPDKEKILSPDNVYLNLKLSGFIGNNLDSSLPKEAIEFFKIIIYFGLSNGSFKFDPHFYKNKIILQDTQHITINRLYLFAEDCSSNYSITDKIELPFQLKQLVNSIVLNKKLFKEYVDEFKEVTFIDQVTILMLSRSFNEAIALYKSSDEEAVSIRAAILWYIDSLSNENKTLGFLQTCIGLEAILGDPNYELGLTKTLADRCAYIISTSIKDRKTIRSAFSDLYKIRSKIVHGNSLALDRNNEGCLVWGQDVLNSVIQKEFTKLKLEIESGKEMGKKIAETKEKQPQ